MNALFSPRARGACHMPSETSDTCCAEPTFALSCPGCVQGATPPAGMDASSNEITCVAWNRKVQHILASSSTNGTTVVWDLKRQKPVISFRDPSRCAQAPGIAGPHACAACPLPDLQRTEWRTSHGCRPSSRGVCVAAGLTLCTCAHPHWAAVAQQHSMTHANQLCFFPHPPIHAHPHAR